VPETFDMFQSSLLYFDCYMYSVGRRSLWLNEFIYGIYSGMSISFSRWIFPKFITMWYCITIIKMVSFICWLARLPANIELTMWINVYKDNNSSKYHVYICKMIDLYKFGLLEPSNYPMILVDVHSVDSSSIHHSLQGS
jgi:hypothetical protein